MSIICLHLTTPHFLGTIAVDTPGACVAFAFEVSGGANAVFSIEHRTASHATSLALLPPAASPVHLVASGWFNSGLSCETQTAFILYAIPLTGDAVQFVIIDRLQAFGFLARPAGVSREFEDLDEAAEASTECDSCLRHRDREIGMEPA